MKHIEVRRATIADAQALEVLIRTHQQEGHLLPRTIDDLRRHAGQFVVAATDRTIEGCAELAPLSASVAEVRSLVVRPGLRGGGVASRLVDELVKRARVAGFTTLTAFTHDARFFVRRNFSIVPHLWVPEKIAKDCAACPLFRHCGQYAMVLSLDDAVASTDVPVAMPAAQRHVAVA